MHISRRSIALLAALALSGCGGLTTTTPATTGTPAVTTLTPTGQLGVGALFTLAQAGAQAFIAKHPAQAAAATALMKTMQADFLLWIANPTEGNAESIALGTAVQALTSYLSGQGVSIGA